MNRYMLAAAFAAASLVTAPALAQSRGDACLQISRIDSWRPVENNSALIVSDTSHKQFRVSLGGTCTGLDWATNRVLFRTEAISTLQCVSRNDRIIVKDNGSASRCYVTSVTNFTPVNAAPAPAAH